MAILDLNKQDSNFESNVEMKSKSFGIGDASAIIDILRNRMYSMPIQTLVQEYICNARDAMIEANTLGTKKIKITAPTKLACQFRVRDFGVGLSEQRVNEVFTLYGNSTKRNTNGQIGGYGLGAKSAWAYTDSFTVVSFFDGVKTTYLCHVGRDNVGSMDCLNKEKTNEANGVEIIVTVKPDDIAKFTDAVNRCLNFWDKNTFELNVTQHFFYKIAYDDGFLLSIKSGNNYERNNFILVDDIVFEMPKNVVSELNLGQGVSVKVKTGIVDVAPSREAVINNEKLLKLKDVIKSEIKKLESEIENAKKVEDKLELSLKYSDILGEQIIKVDDNFTLRNNRLVTNKLKRLTNNNSRIVFDAYNAGYDSFEISKKTFVVLANENTKFALSKLTEYFKNISLHRNQKIIVISDMKEMNNYFHDKLTFIDVDKLPLPIRVKSNVGATYKTNNQCKKILYSRGGGFIYTSTYKLSDITQKDAIKVPYQGFKDDFKLKQVLRSEDVTVYALKKEDFEASKLITLDEFIAKREKEERKKIGNLKDGFWEVLNSKVKTLKLTKLGSEPILFYLTDKERKDHEEQKKLTEQKIKDILKEYPLVSNRSDLEEVALYITLKQAYNKKNKKIA